MIDHLLQFPDFATAVAALTPLGLCATDRDNTAALASNVILNIGGANDQSIRVVLSDAVWDKSNPDPRLWTITTPEVLASGWCCIVSKDVLDPALRDLVGNACRLIADRDAADAGQSFMLYTAPDMDPALLGSARVEPTAAGSRYPFGVG